MSEWYKEWFASEDYLNVYSHRNNVDAEKLIDLILSKIKLKSSAKILDAACGAGRHSIALSQNGFNVTGFDLSKTLLTIAKQESLKNNHNINFFRSDIRFPAVCSKFDLILNLFTSFGYFESDVDNFSFFRRGIDLLTDNGVLVFDYLNLYFLKKNIVPQSTKVIGNIEVFEKREIINDRVVKNITIEKNGKKNNYTESVKLYTYNYLLEKFREIGFSIEEIFGDYNGNPFDESKSSRIILFLKR